MLFSKKNILIFLTFCLYVQTQTKILIFTYAYNRPDFIEIQHKTFEKFLEDDDYEFIVFNDARPWHMINNINVTCERLGIKCLRIPQEIHSRPYLQRWPGEDYNHPTVRNVNVVQYSLNTLGFDHDDILLLLDSDMFLVKPFSIRKFLDGYDIGGRLLKRGSRTTKNNIIYLWHGLAFLNMGTMPNKRTLNFNCGVINGQRVDAGGHSYHYLRNNPDLKGIYIDHNFSNELQCDDCQRGCSIFCAHNTEKLMKVGFDKVQIRFLQSVPVGGALTSASVEFFNNNSFLHYRCGSNWDNKTQEYHRQKTAALHQYLDAILS